MKIKGTIERIRNDRKALSLGCDDWYNSFKELPKTLVKSDYVEIDFTTKETDDKVFKNIKSVILIKKEEVIESKIKKGIFKFAPSDSTINTLIMTTKEIYLSELNKNNLSMETIAEDVTKAYNKIIESI